MSSSTRFAAALLIAGTLVLPSVEATWSIAAVDPDTGEVGLAAASCTYSVHGVGTLVPGKGVVVVQAMSNGDARARGVELLREGAGNRRILDAMRERQFDPENQQYAVIQLNGEAPLNLAGSSNTDWKGGATAEGVTVQGNTLTDEGVVTAALEAYRTARKKDLADRPAAAKAARCCSSFPEPLW